MLNVSFNKGSETNLAELMSHQISIIERGKDERSIK